MNTLVVGATGLVGSDVCARLREAGHHVRAMVRRTSDPAKRQALENQGVELVYGDLKDPTSLARRASRTSCSSRSETTRAFNIR